MVTEEKYFACYCRSKLSTSEGKRRYSMKRCSRRTIGSNKGCLLLAILYCILASSHAQGELQDLNDLDSEELRDTFGIQDYSNIPAHIAFVPNVDHYNNGSIKHLWLNMSELRKIDDSFEDYLSFAPSHSRLLSPEVSVIQRLGNHSTLEIIGADRIRNCHFESKSDITLAALSSCDGNLKGVILKPSGTYVIHPAPQRHQMRHRRQTRSSHDPIYDLHVIYKRDSADAASNSAEFCDLETFLLEKEAAEDEDEEPFEVEDAFVISDWTDVRSRLLKRDEMTIELALFADETLWNKFNTKYGTYAETKLQDFVITIFNNIQLLYQSPTISPKISFKIVHYEVFKQQPGGLHSTYHSSGNAQQYLDVFCKYQAQIRNRDRWDHAFLMSGLNLHKGYRSNSISGIARLHGMCDNDNTCTLTEGLDFTSVFIGTHELGHSVGMRHDEPYCDSDHIMSSSLGPGKVTWSTCSMRDYKKFMQRLDRRGKNCLKTAKRSEAVNRDQTLPGQKYSADQQCEMMHGHGYKQVSPTQDYTEGMCHMMWCGLNGFGRIITSHPALEGTFCGHNQWCLEGKCVQWSSLPSAQPPRIDGAWTPWGGVSCSYCSCPPFPDGVGLLPSRRSCTDPAPQNGGRECEGSAVRGVVCSRDCGRRSDTVEDYTGRICENHRVARNEHELTGKGAQLLKYPSRACKVFCVIRNNRSRRNYRFLGDFLPDGTECGWESYCISGKCLKLSCGDRAVTDSSQDCPRTESDMCQVVVAAAPPTTPSSWRPWEAWSSCSVSCGSGYRSRNRQCQVGTDGSTCQGQNSESGSCNEGHCPWNTWGSCTKSCGGGTMTRTRYCPGGGCKGIKDQTKGCNEKGFCINYVMFARKLASLVRAREEISDGRAMAIRCASRSVAIALQSEISSRALNERNELSRSEALPLRNLCKISKSCIIWSTWSQWTSCSKTCGSGVKKRSRNCSGLQCSNYPNGMDEETEQCTPKYCPWESWGSCSVTCNSGSRERYRRCPGGGCYADPWDTVGGDREVQNCDMGYCYEHSWTDWSSWTACSTTCGAGQAARYRTCKDKKGSEDKTACAGDVDEKRECTTKECGFWSSWSVWSACSLTCGGFGERARKRGCIDGQDCKGKEFETERCGDPLPCKPVVPFNGIWSSWSPWSQCSSRCGDGIISRNRDCVKGPCSGDAMEKEVCRGPCGTWSPWSSWSLCSRSCGGVGKRNRNRHCIGGTDCSRGTSHEAEQCGNPNPCPVPFRDSQQDLRKGIWSSWSVWGACSSSCGTGIQTRHRTCVKGICNESPIDSQICRLIECPSQWAPWGPWSQCTKSCGTGGQHRQRSCPRGAQCDGDEGARQFGPCNVHPCSSPPEERRRHGGGGIPGTWGSWGIWSVCSTSCSDGIQSRARNCYGGRKCQGGGIEEQACNYGPCAHWGGWGQWSGCSKSCGGGVEKRVRNCYGMGVCGGEKTQAIGCAREPCSDVRR